jgi:hypothetical protein
MTGPEDIDITADLNNATGHDLAHETQGTHVNGVERGAEPVETPAQAPSGDKAPDAPLSLRDTLSKAFKEAEDPTPPDGAPAPTPPVDMPDLVKVGDRWHNRDGTFASKEAIDSFNAAQQPVDPNSPPAPAPLPDWANGMTDHERTQLTALPQETRQFVERTMANVMAREQGMAEYGLIEQIIGPRRQAWATNGMPAPTAIQQLFALSDFAGRDPAQFVLWFSDQHRLDLDKILDERDVSNSQQQVDPRYQGLQQEIAQLRNSIDGMTTATAQQQFNGHLQLVQQFTDEKDASGNLLHPYLPEVASAMPAHVSNIRAQQPHLSEREILDAAYKFAAYSDVSVRNRMQADQQKALKDNAAKEAARARAAGGSINGGPKGDASQQANNASRTLREELEYQFNRHSA